jgi:hypothetical protein
MVVCGSVQPSPDDRFETVVIPVVLVEVLPESTAVYDQGEKFRHCRSFPTRPRGDGLGPSGLLGVRNGEVQRAPMPARRRRRDPEVRTGQQWG